METTKSGLDTKTPTSGRDVQELLHNLGNNLKHYEIIRQLGKGGMGMVLLARDTKLGRLVAIKLLAEYSGEHAARFLDEARATARCRHDNIVIIYEVDEIQGYPYMVLEYIEGRTLRAWMNQRGGPGMSGAFASADAVQMSPSIAVELMIPVVRALCCAHEMGIVHRDLKPENILLTDAGQIKVVDFGLAKRIPTDTVTMAVSEMRNITQDGMTVGTPLYMSPEQWRAQEVDAKTDIWAMGVILFELVTGALPVESFMPWQVGNLEAPIPSVYEKRKDVGGLGDIIDRCLKKLKAERIGSAKQLLDELETLQREKAAVHLTEEESPFAGLSAFQEADASRFFGRDRDIGSVLGRLRHHALVVLTGPSGAGKSSLVRAGVIPALKRLGARWEAFIVRPGRRPLASIADVLTQLTDSAPPSDPGASEMSDDDTIIVNLRAQPGTLGAKLRSRCRRLGSGRRILLFVDQLEELVTLGIDPSERSAFLSCLLGVADDASSPLRVVLSIRSDFLDRLADDRQFMTEVTRGLLFLPPMDRENLREALTKPIEAAGYRFESTAMIDGMLDTLENTRSPLPLLQFTAMKLWEDRDRDKKLVSQASYDAMGGVAGALSTHADAVMAAFSPQEQQLARTILVNLVTSERTRAIVSMAELRAFANEGDAVEQVVHRLADARLLLIETGGEREGTTVELIHESLIESWAKLSQWLEENQQDAQFLANVHVAAQQWDSGGQAEGLLWRERAAEDARRWLDAHHEEQGARDGTRLGKREERFLQAVVDLADRTRKVRRTLLAGGLVALSVIAVVVSYLAIRAHEEAQHAKREAMRADAGALQARNATRMAAAREWQTDPTTVLSLLREVEPPNMPRGWSDTTRWALHAGISRVVLTHPNWVFAAAFSPDGKRIATASQDKLVRIWNADGTGQPLVLSGHEDTIFSVAYSPDGKHIATASSDKTARVWNVDGSGQPLVLRGHDDRIWAVAFSPDSKRIVTASKDKTTRVWNADGSGQPLVLRGHEDSVRAASFSSDGLRIVTGSRDKTARVWNADGTGEPIVLRGHDDVIESVDFSPDGQRVVTGSNDRTARVWNADGTGDPLILRGHEEWIWSTHFSPDGKRILTASQDKTARLWNADGTGVPLVFRGHQDAVWSATLSADGQSILTSSLDKTARVWNADQKVEPLMFRVHQGGVFSVAFSPDGTRLVTASSDKTARVWNVDGSQQPVILRGHDDLVRSAVFTPDGQRVVTASWDLTLRIWNADGTGDPLVVRGHTDALWSADVSPDGKRIVTASWDKTARVWNIDGTGDPVILRGHDGGVNSAAFSPDGQRIVTASVDKSARVWHADGSGQPLVLLGHEDVVNSAAFSPDGKRIVTASNDNTARVWNADGTGKPLILSGHDNWVNWAHFSPDGKRILTVSEDKTVRVWNADGTGEPLILRGAAYAYVNAAFSPDGKRIAAASKDSTVSLWSDLEPGVGLSDPRLWTITTYCMPVERRMDLLGISEDAAQSQQKDCLQRVEQAREK